MRAHSVRRTLRTNLTFCILGSHDVLALRVRNVQYRSRFNFTAVVTVAAADNVFHGSSSVLARAITFTLPRCDGLRF